MAELGPRLVMDYGLDQCSRLGMQPPIIASLEEKVD
jgi:hypothetical protein